MRYIIETNDEQGAIGAQITRWVKQKKVELIEKGQPLVEIKAQMERLAKALDTLNKAGYNSEVMKIYIANKAKVGMTTVEAVLERQKDFFKQIGLMSKNKL